ncbi:uncharacterized protein LOC111390350 [Olea europaea var. sylvestris]|uniref:uncharacterized protein LOC111390350 n=1 Tax=Olea europaea var. sylvestris TaxID=158386 RepID=UPI000C1D7E86|nr:uncharacterized protein LOC111390350 [Olea europaea var. sylvestris]
MGVEYCRKSGQIPAFGDWDKTNELPITQYFECARQAGLMRCTCSAECVSCNATGGSWGAAAADLYSVEYEKPPFQAVYGVPPRKTRGNAKRYADVTERRKQAKVHEAMEQRRSQPLSQKNNNKSAEFNPRQSIINSAKPVDEDLYKIPPHLLHKTKRKKMLGFFSRCIAPPCAT